MWFRCMTFIVLIEKFILIEAYQIEELLLYKNYDPHVRPYEETKRPVNITSQIVPTNLGPINEHHLTFSIIFLQRSKWNDERLRWTKNESLSEQIIISDFPSAHIWIPDIYVANAKKFERREDFSRTIVKSNGDVYFSSKIFTTCSCNMDLRKFPFDDQKCFMQFESYAYNDQQIALHWSDQDIVLPTSDKITLPGYELLSISTHRKSLEYGGPEHRFDNLYFNLRFKRNTIYYVYKAFIPTILLSIFNIGSYFIPDNAMPARVTLIITTFLASTLILQSVTEQTIQVPYTTSMQLFLMVNIMFLLLSIFQYLLLLFLKGRTIMKAKEKNRRKTGRKFLQMICGNHNGEHATASNTNSRSSQAQVDKPTQRLLNGAKSGLDNFRAAIEIAIEQQDNHLNGEHRVSKVHYLDRIFRYVVVFAYTLFCLSYFWYYTA